MQELTFVGVSEDGARLLLALADGRRFALPIDERLRAATRGAGRTGQMTIPTETLRPRDVQARLRAGSTAEEVAEQSGWPLDRVEAFAVPVMEERNWVAQQARQSPIAYQGGETPLEEVVAHRLAERAVDSGDFRWDSWRTDSGHWTVLLAYPAGRGDQVATWVFDTDSRTLQPVDDEARWLSEYQGQPAAAAPPAAEPDEPGAQIVDLQASKDRAAEASSNHPALRRQGNAGTDADRAGDRGDEASAEEQQASKAGEQAGRGKRATVPSWDEILFGGTPEDEQQ